jgi:hypothetical protein
MDLIPNLVCCSFQIQIHPRTKSKYHNRNRKSRQSTYDTLTCPEAISRGQEEGNAGKTREFLCLHTRKSEKEAEYEI